MTVADRTTTWTRVCRAEDLIPGSHDYKEATELFGSFPKDELFQASAETESQLQKWYRP